MKSVEQGLVTRTDSVFTVSPPRPLSVTPFNRSISFDYQRAGRPCGHLPVSLFSLWSLLIKHNRVVSLILLQVATRFISINSVLLP